MYFLINKFSVVYNTIINIYKPLQTLTNLLNPFSSVVYVFFSVKVCAVGLDIYDLLKS